jgi:hypothetical protein
MNLVSLMFKVAGLIHFMCCGWYVCSMPVCRNADEIELMLRNNLSLTKEHAYSTICEYWTDPMDRGWIVEGGYIGPDVYTSTVSRYLASFYFTTATMMAVGYGDIYAYTLSERLVAMVIQVAGAAMFGFLMAALNNFLETHNPRAQEIKKRLGDVQEWLFGRECSQNLRDRVRDHFVYYYQMRSHFDNSEFLMDCPERLKSQLLLTINTDRIITFPFFYDRSSRFICALVTEMLPIFIGYQERILDPGDVVRDIYFISAGRVHASNPSIKLVHAVYGFGDNFGESHILSTV